MLERSQRETPSQPPKPRDAGRPRTLCSAELLAGAKEVLIEHRGETYRLRCTRHGKLILYK